LGNPDKSTRPEERRGVWKFPHIAKKFPPFFERQKQKAYNAQIALTGMTGQLMHGDK
jgi:hypothetical protein